MYKLNDYLRMMRDVRRIEAHREALRRVLEPGDVVLDLGAGTGVLSFMAVRAGARRVYAVDSNPLMEIAQEVAAANGLADRISFIQADAHTIELPEQVHCLIGDVRGALPILGDNLDLWGEVRRRWVRPDGKTVPLSDDIFVAPVASLKAHERVADWSEPRPEARYDIVRQFASNTTSSVRFDPAEVVSAAQKFCSVSYRQDNPRKFQRELRFVLNGDVTLTGLAAWFSATLAEGVCFDTSPSSGTTIYGQAFFPMSTPRLVRHGEVIRVDLAAHRMSSNTIWNWRIGSETDPNWEESHSTFRGEALGLNRLPLVEGTRSPALSNEGVLVRRILDAVDGETSARGIAERIAAGDPSHLSSVDEVFSQVIRVLGLYSK
jgi:protein arginine N-methyltransferase 1